MRTGASAAAAVTGATLTLIAGCSLGVPELERVTIGSSSQGRPIRALQPTAPQGRPVLAIGCIHGDECAGSSIVRAIAHDPPRGRGDLVLVPNLNPDGAALGTRGNAGGIDLNRNFAGGWKPNDVAGDPERSGPRPFSEPETRAARRLIRGLRPSVTIWFHQQADALVYGWGPSVSAARRYARLTGLPLVRMPWLPGSAPHWQHRRFPGSRSFVVELATGELSPGQLKRQVGALAATARAGRAAGARR